MEQNELQKSTLKTENYYTVFAWMLKNLNLKGIDLSVFSIIYGFSQDGESYFTGSLRYLCEFTGSNKPAVIKSLQYLANNDLIKKHSTTINGQTLNKYNANLSIISFYKNFNRVLSLPQKYIAKEIKTTQYENHTPSMKIEPNNKDTQLQVENSEYNSSFSLAAEPQSEYANANNYQRSADNVAEQQQKIINDCSIKITDKVKSDRRKKESAPLDFQSGKMNAKKSVSSKDIRSLHEDDIYRIIAECYNEHCGKFKKFVQITQPRIENINYYLNKYTIDEYKDIIRRVCTYQYYQDNYWYFKPENTIFDEEKIIKALERNENEVIPTNTFSIFKDKYFTLVINSYSNAENIKSANDIYNKLSEEEKELASDEHHIKKMPNCIATPRIDFYLRNKMWQYNANQIMEGRYKLL